MHLRKAIRLRGAPVALLGVLALSGVAFAHGGATGIVKQRMETMKGFGAAMKEMSIMFRGKAPYDAARVRQSAASIRGHGGDALVRLFPRGSNPHPSEARAEIWRDWDRFKGLAESLVRRADALAKAADGGRQSARLAFRRLADDCRACHKRFRKRRR